MVVAASTLLPSTLSNTGAADTRLAGLEPVLEASNSVLEGDLAGDEKEVKLWTFLARVPGTAALLAQGTSFLGVDDDA